MTPTELKARFDAAYDSCHAGFDITAFFSLDTSDSSFPATDGVLHTDVALEMLQGKVTYWEHYGWPTACQSALYSIVFDADYEQAQALAEWLVESAPKGLKESHPELFKYAAGEFPRAEVERQQGRQDALLQRRDRALEIATPLAAR